MFFTAVIRESVTNIKYIDYRAAVSAHIVKSDNNSPTKLQKCEGYVF